MSTLLKKKPVTRAELIDAIIAVAADQNHRILKDDEIEWLQQKLDACGEFARALRDGADTECIGDVSSGLKP